MSKFAATVSRRQFLATSAVGAATLAGISSASAADAYGGFKMGVQSYSLRGFDAVTALKHTKTLGLKYWEAYPKHVPMGTLPDHVAKQRKMLADAGVQLIAYGVLGFDGNENKAREAFEEVVVVLNGLARRIVVAVLARKEAIEPQRPRGFLVRKGKH
ncbi:MAG: twin-arginine translocation signal domain-containing protein, partial [Planctomycetaceae bacterium]